MFGFGEIATALASWYGYKTLYALVNPNFGLIVVLLVFVTACLLIRTTLNLTFPKTGGYHPIGKAVIIYFVIPCVFFIFAFTLFYEKKKMDAAAGLQPPAVTSLNRLG